MRSLNSFRCVTLIFANQSLNFGKTLVKRKEESKTSLYPRNIREKSGNIHANPRNIHETMGSSAIFTLCIETIQPCVRPLLILYALCSLRRLANSFAFESSTDTMYFSIHIRD